MVPGMSDGQAHPFSPPESQEAGKKVSHHRTLLYVPGAARASRLQDMTPLECSPAGLIYCTNLSTIHPAMSVRGHIVFMLIATLVAWIAWLMVVTNVNPTTAAWWGFALFYVTLFLSLFGSFTTLGFVLRSLFLVRRKTMQYKVSTSMRQALLWSAALIISLGLQSQRLLSWWIFALVLVVFVLIEFFALSVRNASEQVE
jgi:hypothetical protein